VAITSAVCNSFKQEILVGTHDFTAGTGDTFKVALYLSTANLDAATTIYTVTGETSGAGYSAGGEVLTSVTPALDGNSAVCDFGDIAFNNATITARGCLIYNSTKANRAVCVVNFGSDQISTGGNFTLVFPDPTSSQAIIRLS
jgi:hypothetical protein